MSQPITKPITKPMTRLKLSLNRCEAIDYRLLSARERVDALPDIDPSADAALTLLESRGLGEVYRMTSDAPPAAAAAAEQLIALLEAWLHRAESSPGAKRTWAESRALARVDYSAPGLLGWVSDGKAYREEEDEGGSDDTHVARMVLKFAQGEMTRAELLEFGRGSGLIEEIYKAIESTPEEIRHDWAVYDRKRGVVCECDRCVGRPEMFDRPAPATA